MSEKHEQWAFIFDTLGEEPLRKAMMRVAINAQDGDRVVMEFREGKTMDVTEHLNELEADLDQ